MKNWILLYYLVVLCFANIYGFHANPYVFTDITGMRSSSSRNRLFPHRTKAYPHVFTDISGVRRPTYKNSLLPHRTKDISGVRSPSYKNRLFPHRTKAAPYESRHIRKIDRERRQTVMYDLPANGPQVGPVYKCYCGVSNNPYERIVGGDETRPNEFPWLVGIGEGLKHPFCGGTLINDLYVVTAGHCVAGFPHDDVVVIFGDHDIHSDKDKAFRMKVGKFITHPKFDHAALINDIALLKMVKRIPFSDISLPPCFAPPNIEFSGEMALVSGWGKMEEESDEGSNLLQKVNIPVVPWEDCVDRYRGEKEIPNSVICAAWEEGKRDACEGDSGGPLTWESNGRWYLIGIVSWGIGCARPDSPAIYTRLDNFYDWIDANTKDAATCTD